jgi:chitodextrinase
VTAGLSELHSRRVLAPLLLVAAIGLGTIGIAIASGAAVVYGPSLTRAPYVSDLTQTSAEVNWATNTATLGSVEWGPLGNCAANKSVATNKLPPFQPDVDTANAEAPTFKVGSVSEHQSSVAVSGLSPGTSYCYSVFSGGSSPTNLLGAGSSQTFSTLDATTSSAPLTFDVVGDLGETAGVDESGGINEDQAAIDSEIGQSGAKFLITAGDMAYVDGSNTNYGDLTQTGSEVSDIFGPSYWPATGGIPTFTAAGNHGESITGIRTFPQERTAATSGGIYAYDSYNDPANGINSTTPDDWYAFSDGNTRFYVIDGSWADGSTGPKGTGNATGSLCGAVGSSAAGHCEGYQADYEEHWQVNSPEYKWLQTDLTQHPGGIKFAIFHYPLRSDNATQAGDPYIENDPSVNPNASTSLEALLAENGVDMAFNGHAHTYQRFVPKGANQLISYVTGGGGGTLEPVQGGKTCTAAEAKATIYAIGWSPSSGAGSSCGTTAPASANQVYNFLRVTVSGTTVTVSPENAAGQTFDVFQKNFAASSPDTIPPSSPTNVSATSVTSNQVSLGWTPSTDNVGVTGYRIIRNGSQIGTATSTNYTDSTVSPGTSYQYTVIATDAAGNASAASTPIQVTTPNASSPHAAFVQSAESISGLTVNLSASSATGDLLVLSASLYTGATNHIKAVTDSAGDQWNLIGSDDVSGHNSEGELWFTVAKAPVSAVTVATGATSLALQVQEFSGLGANPTEVSNFASQTSTSASASVTGTGLAIGFVAGHASAQTISIAGTYTTQMQESTAGSSSISSLVSGYQLSVPSGAQAFAGSFTAPMYWAAGIAVFTATG